MGMIRIRNLPDEIIVRVDELAKAQKKSRESFLRDQFIGFVAKENWEAQTQQIQSNFFQEVLPVLEKNNLLLETLLGTFRG